MRSCRTAWSVAASALQEVELSGSSHDLTHDGSYSLATLFYRDRRCASLTYTRPRWGNKPLPATDNLRHEFHRTQKSLDPDSSKGQFHVLLLLNSVRNLTLVVGSFAIGESSCLYLLPVFTTTMLVWLPSRSQYKARR